MTKSRTNTIEILHPSPHNRSKLGDVYDAKLMPAGKHIYDVSGKPLNNGDTFATGEMAEVFGTSAVSQYETHQYPKPKIPGVEEFDFEAGREALTI